MSCFFSELEYTHILPDIPVHPTSFSCTPVQRLQSFIASLPTQTSISTAVSMLTRLLLLYTARSHKCAHLLLGTSLTSLSISLISNISQGGGFGLREEVGETWSPCNTVQENGNKTSVRIDRPLRETGMKECAAWAWWNDLKVVGRDRFVGGKQGIGALTRGRSQSAFSGPLF